MSTAPPPPSVGEASSLATTEPNGTSLDSTVEAASKTNEKAITPVRDDGGFLSGKTFVHKIHTLLAMPNYSSIISWNDAGTAVTIHDVDAFISTIIPKHFRKSKFGSFIRKMRRWGFSVITLKRSTSTTSTSSERGQISVIEFSNDNFLRDKPDQCLLMKDERHVKKQYSFMDSVKTIRREKSVEGSSIEPGIHKFRPPSYATNMHPLNHQADPQQYPRGDNLMPPVAPMANFNMMQPPNNMMQPPTLPPPHPQYQQYGYGTPLSPFPNPQVPQFGSNHYPHQHPSPGGYPPYYPQQYHQHQMMQQNHPQPQFNPMMMTQPDQMQGHHQMMQQNQYHSPPPRVQYMNQNDALSTRRGLDVGTSGVAHTNVNKAVVSSGSEESSETILANTRTDLGAEIQSQKDS